MPLAGVPQEGGGATTSVLVGATPEPRIIDPGEVWIRHVVRGKEGQPSAQLVARAYFVREEVALGSDGCNGRMGWQAAQTTAVLEGDGSFTVAFANTTGDDGVLHRRRFRILTDEAYEPGEAWIEFWRDPNDLIFVGTPTDYEVTGSTVTLKGADLCEVLTGSLSSELDVWDGHSPVDVMRHYARLVVLGLGLDLSNVTVTGTAAAWSAPYRQAVAAGALEGDCWTVEARMRCLSPRPTGNGTCVAALRLFNGATQLIYLYADLYEGKCEVTAAGLRNTLFGKRVGLLVPGDVSVRVVARYERMRVYVAGELVADWRRAPPYQAPSGAEAINLQAYSTTTTLALDGFHADTLAPFASRGPEPVNRQTPGIPPATGLRARYWSGQVAAQQEPGSPYTYRSRLNRVAEEAVADRIEPTLNLEGAVPPYVPGTYYARWEGSIYLDLATSDRNLRGSGGGSIWRVYVGRTMRSEPLLDGWSSGTAPGVLTSGSLREWLGTSEAGWYPVVIESSYPGAAVTMKLEDQVAPSGGFAVVPQSRLSPQGCYSDTIKDTAHRKALDDVSRAFGLQWRIAPKSLESGEFPGQLEVGPLLGKQTSVVLDDSDVGTQAQVQGNAADVMDGLVLDAAGLADPKGSGQLSAQVVDYERARGHMALRQTYESLSEISDEALLKQRADSLLALRSSVNEQVGVRPRGQRDVVDLIPLTGVKAKFDWRPGDGVMLRLENIDVWDESPRQMTSVQWALRHGGVGLPTVGFRQRPRDIKTAIRKLTSAIYSPRRTYQGQIAVQTGTIGGTGGQDAYSRIPLPAAARLVALIANVTQVSGSGWVLQVNGVNLPNGSVSAIGTWDVTPWSTTAGSAYATLGGGTGAYQLFLEAHIVV
jgi:hypothetical protein